MASKPINGYIDHENNFQLNSDSGINIRFQNLIYRVRHHIPWDRCKSCILLHLKGNYVKSDASAS